MAHATTRREMDAATYRQFLARKAASAPEFTPEQVATLRAVFGGAR